MRVIPERLHQRLDIFVDESVMGNVVGPGCQLFLARQFAKKDQVRDLQKAACLGELFDGITAVFQNPFVTIDECDRAFGGRGIHQSRIVGHQPEIVRVSFDLPQVHGAHGPIFNRQRVRFAGAIVRNR